MAAPPRRNLSNRIQCRISLLHIRLITCLRTCTTTKMRAYINQRSHRLTIRDSAIRTWPVRHLSTLPSRIRLTTPYSDPHTLATSLYLEPLICITTKMMATLPGNENDFLSPFSLPFLSSFYFFWR